MKTHKIMFLFLALILGLGSSVQAGTPATQTKAKVTNISVPTKPIVVRNHPPFFSYNLKLYHQKLAQHLRVRSNTMIVAAIKPTDRYCNPNTSRNGCEVNVYYHNKTSGSRVHIIKATQTRRTIRFSRDDTEIEVEYRPSVSADDCGATSPICFESGIICVRLCGPYFES